MTLPLVQNSLCSAVLHNIYVTRTINLYESLLIEISLRDVLNTSRHRRISPSTTTRVNRKSIIRTQKNDQLISVDDSPYLSFIVLIRDASSLNSNKIN